MSLTIHSKYKHFDSTVQRAENRRQKFHFCHLLFAVNVMLNLSNNKINVRALIGQSAMVYCPSKPCKNRASSKLLFKSNF